MQHFTILLWKHSERSFLSVPARTPWNPLVIWWRWAVERTIPRTWPVFSEMVCVQPSHAYLKIRYRGPKTVKSIKLYRYSSVQFSCSLVSDSFDPWTAAHQASLSISNSRSPPKFMPIEPVMTSNHHILCRPLLLLPSIFPSIRVVSNMSALCIRWSKYWSFSFNISPSNEHPGLMSFRIGMVGSPCSPRTLKSLLQHYSSKASILRCSAFFIVQLSHSYMTTGKTIALTRWAFGGKGMSLLFNMLYRLIITSFQGVSVF